MPVQSPAQFPAFRPETSHGSMEAPVEDIQKLTEPDPVGVLGLRLAG